MLPTQLPLPVPAHRNNQLFSDYYLNAILPARPDWASLATEARPVMDAIAKIVRAYTPSKIEAQTENDLVRPVLAALGHTFEVQPALKTPEGAKRPDYVLYRDQAAIQANKNKTLDDDLLRTSAFAVADAKYWERPLDIAEKTTSKDTLTNRNPSFQIAFYMQHSGVEWGILTNGRLWRLYHRDTAHKLLRFYEVDLPALIERDDAAQFLYFWLFFGRAGFDAIPAHGGPSVAAILRASADYARGVGDTLKEQVYEALSHLAQGFLDYTPNALATDAASLKAIYDNALILLYRMLFALYAEARDLLPLRESQSYRQNYSFMAIKSTVANDLDTGMPLLNDSATLWPRLRQLWQIIDRGSPPLKVATFNGGLFDAARHPFLEHASVGDYHLQRAIDMLARIERQFVDYRDLDERHLGTIYEGLLEYHLELQPTTTAATPQVALLNDKGERHATGSYYTPDYIVKYIVEQTVGPILHRAVEGATDDQQRIAAVLRVNVLDPAMGSGHFLVEVVEYIARFLVDLAVQPDADAGTEADLQYWKRRVAQSCIYGVDLNPLAVELAKLSLWLSTVAKDRPLSFLDHHLRTGNALVGARISDLRVGGTEKRRGRTRADRQAAEGQLSLLDDDTFRQSMSAAVGSMWLIEGSAGATIDDVKEQERVYADLRRTLTRRYGRLADLVTATHFGLAIDQTFWHPLADYATGRTVAAMTPRFDDWLTEAERIADRRRFFHWDLEFPEVFFDSNGYPLGDEAGFEAVVGNPPYIRQEDLAPFKPSFASAYPEIAHGTADIFVYFFGRGYEVLQHDGRLSYIASNSWLRANYATPLRAYLRTKATIETLVDLGDNRVFADAPDVYPAIAVVRHAAPAAEHTAQVATFTRGEGLANFQRHVAAKLAPVSMHDQPDSGWQLGDDAGRKLFTKLTQHGRPLGEVIGGQIFRGILTGLNEAFIIDQETRDRLVREHASSAEIIKPILRGEDLRPWYQENEGRWIIFTRRGIDIDSYPAIKAYLNLYRERLEPRPSTWSETKEWPGRKAGSYAWFEIQDSVDYYSAFDKPKIMWPDIGKYPRFSWDESGFYLGNTGYIAVADEPWILGFLASRCAWFLISRTAIALGERAGIERYRLIDQYMRPLPTPDVPTSERSVIGELAMQLTEQAKARYEVHRRAQNRIRTDLGVAGKDLNQKLTAWWTLDFAAFRAEIQKVFKHDIPLKDRDDWEAWLDGRVAAHTRHTTEIVRLETMLNARVYALYNLTPDEITFIEASTKYQYGEV